MGSAVDTVRLQNRFRSALNRGRRQRVWQTLRGRPANLVSLDDAVAGPVARRPVRREQVPVEAIRGSAGRARDYSASFLPLRESDETRWVRVALALEGAGLPPVRLLRYRDGYYVEDGHHRVSVLRALGVETVHAEVVDLVDIPVAVPARTGAWAPTEYRSAIG